MDKTRRANTGVVIDADVLVISIVVLVTIVARCSRTHFRLSLRLGLLRSSWWEGGRAQQRGRRGS